MIKSVYIKRNANLPNKTGIYNTEIALVDVANGKVYSMPHQYIHNENIVNIKPKGTLK